MFGGQLMIWLGSWLGLRGGGILMWYLYVGGLFDPHVSQTANIDRNILKVFMSQNKFAICVVL